MQCDWKFHEIVTRLSILRGPVHTWNILNVVKQGRRPADNNRLIFGLCAVQYAWVYTSGVRGVGEGAAPDPRFGGPSVQFGGPNLKAKKKLGP